MSVPAKREADFLLLDSGASFSGQTVRFGREEPSVKVMDQYELADYDLPRAGHKFLMVDEFVDQELMLDQREKVMSFLDRGNILFFAGHLFRRWIPGASLFVPKTINHHLDYTVTVLDHPIFAGVESEDITYNKGVAGFFCRGHHPLPEGAEVLLRLAGGEPITYADRQSTKGTILLHSGRNLFQYRHRANTSGRIAEQLKQWLYDEHAAIRLRNEVRP